MSKQFDRIYTPGVDCPRPKSVGVLRDDPAVSGPCSPDATDEITEPFPMDALPSVLRNFVREVIRVQPGPEELAAVCAIGVLAAAVGRGLELQRGGGKTTRGNLYVMPLVSSGVGKSETLKLITAPLNELEAERHRFWEREAAPRLRSERRVLLKEIEKMERSILRTTEGQDRNATIDAMTGKEAELQRVNDQLEAPRLRVDDVTTEKLALLLSKNGETVASISADARKSVDNVLGRNLKSKNTDEDVYLKGFSGDSCRVDRVCRESIFLNSPCISILWLVQPDKYDQLASNDGIRESGFLPRFLVCQIKSEHRFLPEGEQQPVNSQVNVAYHDLIRSLVLTYRCATERSPLEIVPEGTDALRTHYNTVVERLHSGELGDIESSALRWTEQVLRLAVVLHTGLNWSESATTPVSIETVRSAIQIGNWFAGQQLALLEGSRATRQRDLKDTIIDTFRIHPHGADARSIYRRSRLTAAFVIALLDEMVSRGEIQLIEERQPEGRYARRLYKLAAHRG